MLGPVLAKKWSATCACTLSSSTIEMYSDAGQYLRCYNFSKE